MIQVIPPHEVRRIAIWSFDLDNSAVPLGIPDLPAKNPDRVSDVSFHAALRSDKAQPIPYSLRC